MFFFQQIFFPYSPKYHFNYHDIAICRKILSIEKGQVIGSGSLEGDQVRLVCDRNYVLVGEEFLRCTNSGNWSASEPICKGKL